VLATPSLARLGYHRPQEAIGRQPSGPLRQGRGRCGSHAPSLGTPRDAARSARSPRGTRQDDTFNLGCATFVDQVSGDAVELAPRRAHVVVHQDAATLRSGRVGDIECGSQLCRCRPFRCCALPCRLGRRSRLQKRSHRFGVERPLAEQVFGRSSFNDALRVTERRALIAKPCL
jgi:hypothetical protein